MAAAEDKYQLVVSSGNSESESESDDEAIPVVKRSNNEAEERARAREEVMGRSRMWQTVGSSDEEEGGDQHPRGRTGARGHAEGDTRGAAAKDRGGSGSGSGGDSDSSEGRKHKKKKEKKDKKHKKDKKKHKKDKKKHKKHKSGANAGAVNQDEYGKYGIIQIADKFRKAREFQAWLSEVKNAPGVLDGGAQWEVTEYFKEFMEDYNTATLPHPKYYNYDSWEQDEYNRKKRKESRKRHRTRTEFNDEEELEAQRARQRLARQNELFQNTLDTMDKDKIEEMRHQKLLQSEMQAAYKRGDMEKVRELEKRLDATEDGPPRLQLR